MPLLVNALKNSVAVNFINQWLFLTLEWLGRHVFLYIMLFSTGRAIYGRLAPSSASMQLFALSKNPRFTDLQRLISPWWFSLA